ncbi:MAG: hypothetical protein EBU90_07770 [Proteobacteria bacterium]|nr:hypothetical protein [Pseudomonadota bacterium]NBP14096.1 hypothetical protein [bacterium]
MKIIKLDRRYSGYEYFRHAVTFAKIERELFLDVRKWFWQTFGSSAELETFWIHLKDPSNTSSWAWELSEWTTRIYIADDKARTAFLLKYGDLCKK